MKPIDLKCKSIEWFLYNRTFCRKKFVDRSLNLLRDSWNYMLPILVPSSAKRIATKVLVIAKLNKREDFVLRGFVSDIILPTGNKVSNWRTRIRCESCSRLRMKTLERCQWCHSSVFVVNCKHISSFVLIVEFEQTNVCCVHIEKTCLKTRLGFM